MLWIRAHVVGVPVEETALGLAPCLSAAVAVAAGHLRATLRRKGLPVREFKIDDYGAPPWPEVVLAVTRKTLQTKRKELQRFIAAVQDGATAELKDPAAAASDIAKASDAKDIGLVRAQIAAVRPILDPKLRLKRSVLEQWATFGARIGLLTGRPDVATAFDFSLAH